MSLPRIHLFNCALVLLAFALATLAYPNLPESIPVHWGIDGAADQMRPKVWAFAMPSVMALVYALMLALPYLSPRGYEVARFGRVFEICQSSVLVFMLALTASALLAGLGVAVPVHRVAYGGAGLLFLVIGNFQGKVTRNFFVGIRTPWTLTNDEVWLRTHRFAGKLMVLGGAVLVLAALFDASAALLLVACAAVALVPCVYSYVLYRRLEG